MYVCKTFLMCVICLFSSIKKYGGRERTHGGNFEKMARHTCIFLTATKIKKVIRNKKMFDNKLNGFLLVSKCFFVFYLVSRKAVRQSVGGSHSSPFSVNSFHALMYIKNKTFKQERDNTYKKSCCMRDFSV